MMIDRIQRVSGHMHDNAEHSVHGQHEENGGIAKSVAIIVERSGAMVAKHPVATLAGAVLVGVTIGWWAKRS